MFGSSIYSKEFLGLMSANLFFWMSVNFFLPVLPLYYHSLGMDDYQVGLAIGVFSVGAVLFRVLSGKAVDRYGSIPVITVGVIISAIAIIGYYYSYTLLPAMTARFLHGIGISGYSAAALTMVTLMHEARHTAQAVGVYALSTMFGMGIAASSANWLFATGDMPLVIVCGVTATIMSLLFFPRKPQIKANLATGESLPFRTVAAKPGIFIPTANLLGVCMCFGTIMTFLPLMMLSYGMTRFSLFYIAYSITVILSRFWVSRLCDWLAPERLAFYVILTLGLTMLAVGEFVSEWVMVLSGAGIGIGYGLAFPTMATIVTAHAEPVNRGTAFGFFTMAIDTGFAVGAIGMGMVAAVWGYQAVFIGAGIYMLGYSAVYRIWLWNKLARSVC